MKLAQTLVLLLGLPCFILVGTAGVVLAACQATYATLLRLWSRS